GWRIARMGSPTCRRRPPSPRPCCSPCRGCRAATPGNCRRRRRCSGSRCWPKGWCRWRWRRRSCSAVTCAIGCAGAWCCPSFWWRCPGTRSATGATGGRLSTSSSSSITFRGSPPARSCMASRCGFTLPILLAGLLPWTPLLGLIARRRVYRDRQRVFLAVWVLAALLLFSIPFNKLPGYILPLLPAAAVLMALALDEAVDARPWLAACGALLVVFPITAQVLPAAVLNGLSRAPRPLFQAVWLAAAAVALLAWLLEARGKRVAAVLAVAAGAAVGIACVKTAATPQLERHVSARGLWREIGGRAGEVCIGNVKRDWQYGLNYYSVTPLPDCEKQPKALQVLPGPGGRAYLEPAP